MALGAVALGAGAAKALFVVPPLGATTFICMARPDAPPAAPRNAILAHAVGASAGALANFALGLAGAWAVQASACDPRFAASAALALFLTVGTLLLLRLEHPPAGATTVIVSLGFVADPSRLAAFPVAAAVVAAFALGFHRARGVEYPLWGPKRGGSSPRAGHLV